MTAKRPDGRTTNQLRQVSLVSHVNPHAEGSCLVKFGTTEVLCTASVQDKVPAWLRGQGKGWVTAEYGMLPRATSERKDREAAKGKQEGRTIEIQRLIGRSIRSIIDLEPLNNLTIWLDCDVIVADGGTRTAAITGAYVALELAIRDLMSRGKLKKNPLRAPVAAISCGVTDAGVVLDMDYAEDSNTYADGNFVMSGNGEWIEMQISAERRPLTAAEMQGMQDFAATGIRQLFDLQRQILAQE